jgi:hypothetical protein
LDGQTDSIAGAGIANRKKRMWVPPTAVLQGVQTNSTPPSRLTNSCHGSDGMVARTPAARTLWVGFDSEYKCQPSDDPEELAHNEVVSYQLYCIEPSTEKSVGKVILAHGRRLSLAQLLASAVEASIEAGIISKWPPIVVLVGHFTLADLCSLRDFSRLKKEFNSIRGTYLSLQGSKKLFVNDSSRNGHAVKLILRDSMCLTPDGQRSLEAIGKVLGIEKIVIGDHIKHMDVLLKEDPELYHAYALRDAEIAARYTLRISALCRDLGLAEMPPTLSSVAVGVLQDIWEKHGVDRRNLLGLESIREKHWHRLHGRVEVFSREVQTAERAAFEQLAVECFHGGRNEAFTFGAGHTGRWSDWDLAGAYTTALALIGFPDWQKYRRTTDPEDFEATELGFARVRFSFPPDTRFPCLPVTSEHGLIFPLAGESHCCSPEIALARRMGAQIEVLDGVVLPSDYAVQPFLQFVKECAARRSAETKGSLNELFWKEMGNAVYGKVAQGLSRKRVFDSRNGEYHDPYPSKISCAPIAAWVTSFVRAVLGEILATLPPDVTVTSCTTDGFITDAADNFVNNATKGPLCAMFAAGRAAVVGTPQVLVQKHIIAAPLCWRTRGQATIATIPGVDPDKQVLLAKAGLKPPRDCDDPNNWILQLFLKRNYDTHIEVAPLRSLVEIWNEGGDLVAQEGTIRVNMEYDFKRRPAQRGERDILEVPHLYFDTKPWETIDQFSACREALEAWRKATKGCLKELRDLKAFELFWQAGLWGDGFSSNPNAMLKKAKAMVLRAYVRQLWGFTDQSKTRAELVQLFKDAGVVVQVEDFENARRASALPHVTSCLEA